MNTQAVLSGTAGLVGIQRVVKGRTVRRMLHQELAQMLQPDCVLGPLALTRVKFKPGRKLIAYYTCATTGQGEAQPRKTPIAVTWRGAAASGEADKAMLEMEEAARQRGLAAPFNGLQRDVSERTIRLQIWPLDPEFPQLVRISDPAYTPRLFQSARVDLDSAALNPISITPIRYRPTERHVLRYRVGANARLLYGKLYAEAEQAARAARITQRAVDWLDANLQDFHGVRPEGVSLEDAVILYPHADGKPLSQQLRRTPAWLGRQLQLVGTALATLHRGPESLLQDLELATLEQEIKVIQRASEHVQVFLPEVGASILRLLDQVQSCYSRLPQEAATFTHADFKADHLLISPSGMSLIDFDTCSLADPALDIGKFLADLAWWHDLTHTPHADQAQEEFLRGYGTVYADGRMQRARLYQSIILVKIAIRRTRLYWNDWAEVTTRMVQRAEAVFAEHFGSD